MASKRFDNRAYITVHDGMPENPKIEPLSDAAFRLLIELWTYSNRNTTDGKVTAVRTKSRGPKARKELVNGGLLEELDDGRYYCHDYLKHQKSKAEIEEASRRAKENGAKGGRPRLRAVGET